MPDGPSHPTLERRRSQRVSENVPLVVRGIDLLGNPFEERTTTQSLNLQGCRYFSTHHLPRNSWISLEVGEGQEHRNVRARVAWIKRPHSIRELFHVAIELEGPANIWGLRAEPEGWAELRPGENLYLAGQAPASDVARDSLDTSTEGPTIVMESFSFEPAQNLQVPPVPAPAPSEEPQESAVWRTRFSAEMAIAQRQWDEVLQSSIDRTLERLAEQLPERAQLAVRSTEEKIAEQYADLGQMLAHLTSEAQGAVASAKASVDQEIWRVRDAIENTRQQLVDRIAAEAEARVAPHAARVPELLRELARREELIAESLRLHRERLRQASDNALREVAGQAEGIATALRSDFETARVEALAKWGEEIERLSARSGHAAGEAISRTSEWIQQETRERLQVLAEQTLANATTAFEQETSKAAAQFATHLEGQSVFHLAQVHQQLDHVASDLAGRTRSQLSEAAAAAAASFGQVLGSLAEERAEKFASDAEATLAQKRQEIDEHAQGAQAALETSSSLALDDLRQKTSWHLETAVGEVRNTLAGASTAALEAHQNEHAARTQQFSENLRQIAADVEAQSGNRMETAADTWTVASVRRLNEHGQNAVESLIRSADQALRDSASRIFEKLAAALRQPGTDLAQAAAVARAGFPEVSSENYADTTDNFAPTSHQPLAEPTAYQQDPSYGPEYANPPNETASY